MQPRAPTKCTPPARSGYVSSTLDVVLHGKARRVAVAPWLPPIAHVGGALSRSAGRKAWPCFKPTVRDNESKTSVLSHGQPHCAQHGALLLDRIHCLHHTLQILSQLPACSSSRSGPFAVLALPSLCARFTESRSVLQNSARTQMSRYLLRHDRSHWPLQGRYAHTPFSDTLLETQNVSCSTTFSIVDHIHQVLFTVA